MNSRQIIPTSAHPGLEHLAALRHEDLQSRIADRITRFAGSMPFVYVHVVWFGLWIGLGVERYPFGLLTMIVSLEAIFLSTFVMISQNRADEKRKILDLTTGIHQMATGRPPRPGPGPPAGPIG